MRENPQIVLTAMGDGLAGAWNRWCGDLPGVEVWRGSILDCACDAVVSPANSFGFMDGGIDGIYLDHFGRGVQDRLRAAILTRHDGELLVGQAEIVPSGDEAIPWLIAAPTMRVPMALRESVAPYLAARAVLLLWKNGTNPATGRLVPEDIRTIAFPGLGTGVGRIGPQTCARQVRQAIEDVLHRPAQLPRSWAEASERHQLLYTDRPRNLQRD